MASCTDRSDSREEGSRKKTTARDTTTACVSGKIHYVIPVPLLFVAKCTYEAMRQRHPQPIGGARSGWRRNARALRDDGKTKQNELAVRTLARRLVLLGPKTNDLFMLLQMLDDCRHVRSLDCLPYWRPFLSSSFAPGTTNFASRHQPRFQSTPPCASPSLARRNARSD